MNLYYYFIPCENGKNILISLRSIRSFHFKQRNSTNLRIGGMSSAQKPPINWWNSERQKPRNVIANEIMPPISDGWFLTHL